MLILVAFVSMTAAALTLFSGFGLGALLMPTFAFFFPLHIAVAITGIVHLANNLFKLVLVGKHASLPVAVRFDGPSIPATASAFCGSFLGARYMKKVTLTMVKRSVGTLLFLVGLSVAAGWI